MAIQEVAKYICKKYPNSCLSSYYSEKLIEYELFEECYKFFKYEKIGLCGCGDPDSVMDKIRVLLKIIRDNKEEQLQEAFGVSNIYDNELLLFMIYILNDKDILEHGTGVGGSWLTEEGRMLLYVLENFDF